MLAATPVLADDDLIFSMSATEACLSDEKGAECIGLSAGQCMEDSQGGHSTYGMGGCLSLEIDYWDARLNAAYQALMTNAKKADLFTKESGGHAPSQAETLREMQRSWIPYRDTRCGFEMSLWGGGTGGGPASASCYLQLTGEQALYLEDIGAWY